MPECRGIKYSLPIVLATADLKREHDQVWHFPQANVRHSESDDLFKGRLVRRARKFHAKL